MSIDSTLASPFYNDANLYINNALLEHLVIPNDVANITDYLFYVCTSLESIDFENKSSLIEICEYSFVKCINLIRVNVQDGVFIARS